MKYAVVTFGCRVNQADSLQAEEALRRVGAEAGSGEQADLVLVNSCAVTSTAEQGTRQAVRRLARQNPRARIVVTGCYATRSPDAVGALPGVVRIFPNEAKDDLVEVLHEQGLLTAGERFGDGDGPCGAVLEPGMGGRTVMTLRVQTGCDERCTYCIIPSTRGHGRSLPPDEVCRRVALARRAGYREVVLTGVHLGSYGRDLAPSTDLPALLARLDEGREGVRFRLSSLEPMDCTASVIDAVADRSGLAPWFHLPLQHGSDRILRLMGRPYSAASFSNLTERIRARMPHAAIGSDLIVGFPGETSRDFEETLAFLERSPLTSLHVFPYSDRPGTIASRLEPKVPGEIVRERAEQARAAGRRLAAAFRQAQIGTRRQTLVLRDGLTGLTDNGLRVALSGPAPPNQWIEATVTGTPERLTADL